jgi:hypothetical protein
MVQPEAQPEESAMRSLQEVLASNKAPERWLVQSWDWAGH